MRVLLFSFVFIWGVLSLKAQSIHTCTEMPVSESSKIAPSSRLPEVASRAVSYKPQYGLYWTNGSTIRIKFIGGSDYVRAKVKQYASYWTRHANLNFQFVNYGRSDIRVSFVENGSSWSVIGKQALQMGSSQATMNFGWLNDRTPEYEFKRTILHEFGHALGLLHEHQNPDGGIPWNEEAVYNHYWRTQGWDQRTTYQNVIQRARRNATQFSDYDPESIMHYPVSQSLTYGEYRVGMNHDLSPTDIAYVRKIYPGRLWSSSDNNINTNEGNNRPPVVEETRPTQRQYIVTISNELGQNQIKETVDLYLDGEKYTFELDANGRTQKSLRFSVKPGRYSYSLSSASTYRLNQRVWNGWRYERKKVNRTIYGSGTGSINISNNSNYALYGDYDADTKRMNIYLGETERRGLATTNVSNRACRE